MRTIFAALVVGAVALDAQGNHPVERVINLLNDMKASLEEEAANDKAVYEKFACWCNVNEREKTKAIAENEQLIQDQETKTEELSAEVEKLEAEIAKLEEELQKLHEELQEAREILKKETEEFNEKRKDELEYLRALDSAITILKKHQPESLAEISKVMHQGLSRGYAAKGHEEAALIDGFLQQQNQQARDYFGAAAVGQGAGYSAQSGQIYGVLRNMRDVFKKSLGEEFAAQEARLQQFQELEQTKEEAIKNTRETIAAKQKRRADALEELAGAEQMIKEARETLKNDQKFLAELKMKCQNIQAEFDLRTKTRVDESQAIEEALKVLTSDEAHDKFSAAFNKDFLQITASSRREMVRRAAAAKVLLASGAPKLVALSVQVKLDAFTKVKKAIDDMIASLQQEAADEIKHKEFCTQNFAKNSKDTALNQKTLEGQQAELQTTKDKLAEVNDRQEAIQEELAELKKQFKRATDNRGRENDEFQTNVKEQRAALELLQKADEILKNFYAEKQAGVASEQTPEGLKLIQQEPPAGFKPYEKQGGAGGVLGMMEQIMNDIKKEEAELLTAESDSQNAYEEFGRDTNVSIEQREEEFAANKLLLGELEKKKVDVERDIKDSEETLDRLAGEKTELHNSCDFTLKNFDIRQKGRNEEIEALRQAKSILSGANFNAFLQRH